MNKIRGSITMTTVVLVFHIILAIAMVGIILIQKNEGGGLGMGSGTMGGLMSTRGTANLLTRTTAILAGLFFLTTLLLAILFKGAHKAQSILDHPDATKPAIEVPVEPAPSPITPENKAQPKASKGSSAPQNPQPKK